MPDWTMADGKTINMSQMTVQHLVRAHRPFQEKVVVLEAEMKRRGMEIPKYTASKMPQRTRPGRETRNRFRNIEVD